MRRSANRVAAGRNRHGHEAGHDRRRVHVLKIRAVVREVHRGSAQKLHIGNVQSLRADSAVGGRHRRAEDA